MSKKKHHIILGIVCLIINIILPTVIYNYYLQVRSLCETLFNYADYLAMAYALIIVLSLLWLGSMYVALKELGGYVQHLGESNYVERYRY